MLGQAEILLPEMLLAEAEVVFRVRAEHAGVRGFPFSDDGRHRSRRFRIGGRIGFRRARLEHLGESLAQMPTIRGQIARTGIALAAQRAYLRLAAESVTTPDDRLEEGLRRIEAWATK